MDVKLIIKRSVTFCALTLSTLTFAKVNVQPSECPTTQAIQSVAFDVAQKVEHLDLWNVIQKNHNYDTQYNWNLSVVVKAKNQEEAFKNANNAISQISKLTGPAGIDFAWFCDYKSDSALSIVATTQTT